MADTPCYLYDLGVLESTLHRMEEASTGFRVHYAVKANFNPRILSIMAAHGLGADCVSGGEVKAALEAGIPAGKIVYAGVGKTDAEIRLALSEGIGCLNVESVEELEVIAAIAAEMGTVAPVALRVNPDIDAHTHHYITTGLAENKFGISLQMLDAAIDLALSLPSVSLQGLHFHIGSQILTMEPFAVLSERINSLQDALEARGVAPLRIINVGGGLGIDYDHPAEYPDFEGYFDTFRRHLRLRPGQEVHCELGRALVAQCGTLLTTVLYVKQGIGKKFAIVDAGMTELIRPALYGSYHAIDNLTNTDPDAPVERYDVVGPVCESSDVFGTDRPLPLTRRGYLLGIRSAGAYGEAMASHYNLRSLRPALFN